MFAARTTRIWPLAGSRSVSVVTRIGRSLASRPGFRTAATASSGLVGTGAALGTMKDARLRTVVLGIRTLTWMRCDLPSRSAGSGSNPRT